MRGMRAALTCLAATLLAGCAAANQHPVLKGELEGVLPLVKVGR